jgi:broad specificity phosphatase PhoE
MSLERGKSSDRARFIAPPGAVTRWWWVRHAPVAVEGEGIYGADDIPADFSDRPAFENLARRLPKSAVWITSHLRRAKGTAAAIAEAGYAMPTPIVEPLFAEQDYGVWQGRPHRDILPEVAAYGRHKFWFAAADAKPAKGESFRDVIARVAAAVTRFTLEHAGRDIVAVAHGGVIRAALAHALAIDPDRALGISADNLSTTRLDHVAGEGKGGDWRLVFVNARAR